MTAVQPAPSLDRDAQRIQELLVKMERRFSEIVAPAKEQESELDTLRRAIKRTRPD